MTIKHHVALDRARKTAKALSRGGGLTHQQALDQIAREAGFDHWNAMASADPEPRTPVLQLTGPAAVASPPEFGPSRMFFELDEWDHLRAPETSSAPDAVSTEVPTLAGVAREMRRLMAEREGRPGMKINEWVGRIMRDAAARAVPDKSARYVHAIRPLPFDARMVAQAVDPKGGPWDDADILVVRCPLHDDTSRSLFISGSGENLRMKCMAGCSSSDLQDKALGMIANAAASAITFMALNDRHRVISGFALGREGAGGMGGRYGMANGWSAVVEPLSGRMLTEGYPLWIDGHMPRAVGTMDRALRTALAGRFPIDMQMPEDRARGMWRYVIDAGYGYSILMSRRQGQQIGVNAGFSGRFSVDAAETYDAPAKAVARVLELLRKAETLDPVERTANEVGHKREIARDAELRGEVNGWGWWVGPDEGDYRWGGPWKTRKEAISQGNGHCDEETRFFYVVEARVDGEGPDDDGTITFAETRRLKRCRAT